MDNSKPWAKTRLMKCLLADMAPLGFVKYDNETLRLQNEEVSVYVTIDIARCHRNPGDTERTIYLNFWVDFAESPLDPDPRGERGLWGCMVDEYLVFNQTGPYKPYTLSAKDSYDTSRLRKDLLDFGLPLLMAYATKQGALDMLCGSIIQLCGKTVQPFYPARRFHYALALYLADRMNLNDVADRVLAKIRVYIDESEENRLGMKKLLHLDAGVANVLNRRDKALYNSITGVADSDATGNFKG